jgi:catechol-2,3-dioxygenase
LWLDDYKSYVADFVNWHARSVYFSDPAGNILELIARFDLRDEADEIFSSMQFRNISEIGLVFSDEVFDKNVHELLKNYKLQYFSKQPPLAHFRAIGDDEGLFIVVPENRNWFSTRMASGIFPIEVSFIHDNELLELKM